ncbi:hypothetical protein D3C81_1228090 [compost metagenome]
MQLAVHFTGRPQQAHGVLRHFQARHGYAARIGGLARGVQNAGVQEDIHSLEGSRHVGAFGHTDTAVTQQGAGIFGAQLVLRGAWQGDVARQAPRGLALAELQAELPGQLADTSTLDVFQLHQGVPLGVGQAGFCIQGTFRVRQRDHLAAQVHDLTRSILGDVARTRHRHAAAVDTLVLTLEHFFGEVNAAIAGGFRADQAAAIGHALAGQHRGELVGQALVLAEHEADFAGTHADVTGRYVAVGANVAVQLAHERLAEAHHFGVALAFRVKVRAALAATHGQRG